MAPWEETGRVMIDTPRFRSEAEEARWLDKHQDLLTGLLIKHGRRAVVQTKSVTVRLPITDIDRARELATGRGMGHQTLIKTLLHDALQRAARKAS
jgi:predicted DNA binding CopG/RHH family protein